MFPLLALTAAKVGSNLLSNAAASASEKSQAAPDAVAAKKMAFAQMMAKVANNPQLKSADYLSGQGINRRSDAEMTINQLSQKIIQSPEVSAITSGRSDAFDLKFLPDGNVSITTNDGREQVVKLDGALKESAQQALKIIENVKIAYPQSGVSMTSHQPGGTLRIIPGGTATLSV